jgi:hypothetical protein
MTESQYPSQRLLIFTATLAILLIVIASALLGSRLQLTPIASPSPTPEIETPAPTEDATSSIAQLTQMEALWDQQGILSYTLIIDYLNYGYECSDDYALTITVENDEVAAVETREPCEDVINVVSGGITIDNLFDAMRDCDQKSEHCDWYASYDTETGAPNFVFIDPEIEGHDEEWFVRIKEIVPKG